MKQKNSALYGVLAVLLVVIAAPLAMVLITAVVGYRGEPSALGFFADPHLLRVTLNTVWLGLIVVVFSTLMAAPLALAMSWTKLARHTWIDVVVMIPFMTPPFAAALGWMDITRTRGPVWQIFGESVGQAVTSSVYSVWGMGLVMACETFPFLYLVLRTALGTVPASSLEMAAVTGASRWQVFRRIFLPLIIGPYSLGALIVFIKAAGEFGTPVTLGNAIGYEVLVSAIQQDITVSPISFTRAAASSSILFALGVTAWALQQFLSRGSLDDGGRTTRAVTLDLPRGLHGVLVATIALVILVSVVIPYVAIVLAAMTILRSKPPTPNNLTFDYFGIVLGMPSAQEALGNSLLFAVVAATLTTALGVWVTLATLRRRSVAARLTDFVAIAPDTVPGIVMAVGLILLWNSPWLPVTPYGHSMILPLGYTALFLPMVVQNIKASFRGLTPALLEAAVISGASPLQVLRRITLPALAPGIIAGWSLAFLVGIRELVVSSLVRPSNLKVLAPWIMNQYDQGMRAEAMAMTLISVGTSTMVLVAFTAWQRHGDSRRDVGKGEAAKDEAKRKGFKRGATGRAAQKLQAQPQ